MNSVEIAKLAGVSRSTVSRVVNNYGNVPPETKQRVLEVIKKYNYVPHASAQRLAGKKSRIIGVFVIDPIQDVNVNKMTTSSYFSPFISASIDTANKQQYNVLVSIVNTPRDFENVKEIFYSKSICGGIFIGGKNNDAGIKKIIESGYKVVVVEQEVKDEADAFNKCIIVNSDSFGGACDATNYLIKLGHTRIAHITGDLHQLTASLKLEGYKKAMGDAGLDIDEAVIIKGNYIEESGYKAAQKLLSGNLPTAVFVANDSMAIGAMRAIQDNGLKVPDDISIMGFDDIELAAFMQPGLTTVRVPLFQVASAATNNLIKASEEDINLCDRFQIPVELVIRGSCREIQKK